jgi:hypothetical protein
MVCLANENGRRRLGLTTLMGVLAVAAHAGATVLGLDWSALTATGVLLTLLGGAILCQVCRCAVC